MGAGQVFERQGIVPTGAKKVLPMRCVIVFASLCLLGVVAPGCASKQAPQSTAPPPTAGVPGTRGIEGGSNRARVIELMQAIGEHRVELGLPAQPDATAMSAAGAIGDSCPDHATEGTCGDVCKLADDICGNKDRICEIADQEADPWFTDRCTSAKASCNEASSRCCGCEN